MIKNTHKTLNFLWLLTSVFIATLNAALFVRVKVIFIVTFYNYHIKCNKKWYSGLTGEVGCCIICVYLMSYPRAKHEKMTLARIRFFVEGLQNGGRRLNMCLGTIANSPGCLVLKPWGCFVSSTQRFKFYYDIHGCIHNRTHLDKLPRVHLRSY